MLHDFLTREREPILAQCEQDVLSFGRTKRSSGPPAEGWHIFYDQLIDLMARDKPFEFHAERGMHSKGSEEHAKEYVKLGYTVSEVVHSYGVICQAITEFAQKLDYHISSREFQQLNLSLDTAIAEAVTEFERIKSDERRKEETEWLGYLAHELRNSLQSATIALEMIGDGSVGARSNTGSVLQNSLRRMAELIDTALTEVRMRIEPVVHLQKIRAFEIMSEVGITSGFEARSRNIILQMQGYSDLEVIADRQLVVSALAILVQNAMKFTPSGGTVQIRARREYERIFIEVEDQCGGLSEGEIDEMLGRSYKTPQAGPAWGPGLTVSRRAIELSKGKLRFDNLPGDGCIFILDLPNAVEDESPSYPAGSSHVTKSIALTTGP